MFFYYCSNIERGNSGCCQDEEGINITHDEEHSILPVVGMKCLLQENLITAGQKNGVILVQNEIRGKRKYHKQWAVAAGKRKV